jgi:WD40 repeat protein
VLGGEPQLIARDVGSNLTFSPDGKYLAYGRRNDPEIGKWQLLRADIAGGGEQVLLSAPLPDSPIALAWSPDGARIAIATFGYTNQFSTTIDLFNLSSNLLETFVKTTELLAFTISWTPDGRDLLAVFISLGHQITGDYQIGVFSYPDGKFNRVTNDAVRITPCPFLPTARPWSRSKAAKHSKLTCFREMERALPTRFPFRVSRESPALTGPLTGN